MAVDKWDNRFSQIKEHLAKKCEIFQELYALTDGRQYRGRMKKAFKTIKKAAAKINRTRNPLREIIRLFVYDASLTLYDYWKTKHVIFVEQAKQYVEEYGNRKRELPDLLDENFFKHALSTIKTWQI